jgi:hypothetical protein
MKNIFSLIFVNDAPSKRPFVPRKARQKEVWYHIKNAIDPLTGESYGDIKYKVVYINNRYKASNLISSTDSLISSEEIAKRFYAELINFLDDQKFNSIFDLTSN